MTITTNFNILFFISAVAASGVSISSDGKKKRMSRAVQTRERFKSFATVTGVNDEHYMTPIDFIDSLTEKL